MPDAKSGQETGCPLWVSSSRSASYQPNVRFWVESGRSARPRLRENSDLSPYEQRATERIYVGSAVVRVEYELLE